MIQYLLKRIFLIIPTLLVISLLCFFLSQGSQRDVVNDQLEQYDENISSEKLNDRWDSYHQKIKEFGLNKAAFYFSVYRKSSSDTLFNIPDLAIKKSLEELSYHSGSWALTDHYFFEVKRLLFSNQLNLIDQQHLLSIARTINVDEINTQLSKWKHPQLTAIKKSFNALYNSSNDINNFLPTFKWHGINNQYHQWIIDLLQGDLGKSNIDGRSVKSKIGQALYWTILLSIISIILSFSIGIITGVYSAYREGSRIDTIFNLLFYGLYSLPNFWVATLLILFFASGDFLQWFPPYGLGQIDDNMSWMEMAGIRITHLILPIICLTYGSIAFIHRQVRNSMLQQLKADYVVTAKAKGLTIKKIVWSQAFKNASFPIITMGGSILPAIVSGSFIIEYIFSIPGMGKLSVDSILSRDFPTVFGILMLSAALGIIGILIADILYFTNDPRLSFNNKSKATS